jgi:hypothetical protein
MLIGEFAIGSGKVGLYAIRMVPYGQDAETYSRPSWGGGIHAVFPLPFVSEIFAVTGGFEFVDFLNKKIDLRDNTSGLGSNKRLVRPLAGSLQAPKSEDTETGSSVRTLE